MLFGGKKSRQLVGLDIGSSSIKSVELKSTKAGYELVSFGMESLAPDTVVDGAIMDAPQVANAISRIFDSSAVKTKNVATSVSGHSVIVKRVPLPLMNEDELYDRIPAEASQHIPFDIADVNLRSEEHTSELQSRQYLVCRLLLEKKKTARTRCPPRSRRAT